MKISVPAFFIMLFFLAAVPLQATSIDDVTFLTKVQTYKAGKKTTLVTQEGKRLAVKAGTVLNVAGFAQNEAFVVSRKDKPNGFVKRADIVPVIK